ncbi:MAG TPA: glutamate--tRNA ligase [Bacilli bacterium]|nr:glutamate--tRNA ligase [Bacilli bacterium]
MNNKQLAEILFPNITKTVEDYELMYPERNLQDKAEVTRFAPSPTGRIHMGSLFASFIPEVFARQSDGVYILRIEDTDQKRSIENGTELIIKDLEEYNYIINESPIVGGEYGPYIQTKRKEIYQAFAKYLVSIGRAYPCFCTEEDLQEMRDEQESIKDRVGYYGRYARCRNLTLDEVKEKLNNNDKFVIRLKSMGDFNKRIIFKDLVKGTMELPENDIDHVILKSDGIPPYAFAHVVDDHLMRTTTVTRDDSYISSVPYHLEIWNAFGFKIPKFAHILPLCVKDGDTFRKISKRKDPEAAISFYHEKGIPVGAVNLYLATLLNSNFEEWYLQNQDKSYRDFKFTFNKMTTSGSLFDIEKLLNISKNYISKLTKEEVYNNLLTWAKEFDNELEKLLENYKDYSTDVLNIERCQKKPRKDFACYNEIKDHIWYMYDELFIPKNITYDFQTISDREEIDIILSTYITKYYDVNDDKETWFNKMKELCIELGYCPDMKEYKENSNNYKGSIADVSMVIRVALTTKSQTPDLYEIMKLLGKDRIEKRVNILKD